MIEYISTSPKSIVKFSNQYKLPFQSRSVVTNSGGKYINSMQLRSMIVKTRKCYKNYFR